MQIQEQVIAAQQKNVELFIDLHRIFAETAERLTRLGMETIHSTLGEALDASIKAVSVKEPQEWWTLQSNQFALAAETSLACNRQLLDISASGRAQCAKLLQAHMETYGRQARTLAEDIVQHSPANSAPIVTVLDSAISAVTTLYEALRRTGQQAVEVTRTNYELAASAESKSTKRAIEPLPQAAKR